MNLKSIFRKKWILIPCCLALVIGLLAAGAVYGSWHYTQTLSSSTVQIKGSGLTLYTSSALTTAYAYPNDTLPNFSLDSDTGSAPFLSNVVDLYLVNTGTKPLSPSLAMTSTGNMTGLTVSDATAGILSSNPVSLLGNGFTASGLTSQFNWTITASAAVPISTQMSAALPSGLPTSGYLQMDNEIFHYSAITASDTVSIDQRACLGTTAALHHACTVTWGVMGNTTLAPGQTFHVQLQVSDNGNAVLGSNPTIGIVIDSNAGN